MEMCKKESYLIDIKDALRKHEVILMLSNTNRKLRYARTRLGSWWIALSQAIYIIAVGMTMSFVWGQKIEDYLPYFAISQILWALAANVITSASGILPAYSGYLKDMYYPRSIFTITLTMQNCIELLIGAVILIPIQLIFMKYNLGLEEILRFILSITFYILTVQNICHAISLLGARFRDLQNIINSFMQVLYFLTPILWKISSISEDKRIYFELNPIFINMELCRMSLYGDPLAERYIIIASFYLLLSYCFAILVHRKLAAKITYWL